ncbi:MAG: glycosyltransferase [Acidobacteria bacterium]|nr:glycosyltransferase [Acidobacteriota bacterium]
MKALLKALLEALFALLVAPWLLLLALAVLWLADLIALLLPKKPPADEPIQGRAASVVIPTWNGRHHLEANLASVVEAMAGHPDNEVIVVENGSDDGTVEYLRQAFPTVRVLDLDENLGFGGGSNLGFREAKNDIVVLLNNDMRVEPDFLAPLLEGFDDPQVFAVTAQIFFSDPTRRREETGLTHGRWTARGLELGHAIDDKVDRLFPAFYAGGGSSAYDRRKFLEIGGFDALLRPFYYEDSDVSFMAWKRGWKVLYAPGSVVYHEHRGTIGKKFTARYVERVIDKNRLLFVWKNIHGPHRLIQHTVWVWASILLHAALGPSPLRPDGVSILMACRQLLEACGARLRARRLATVGDGEAFRRHQGGYFRDRFAALPARPEPLNILFVSPYSIEPPVHGGAVFMNQTVRRLASLVRLHLFCLVDEPRELAPNQALDAVCASVEVAVRRNGPSTDAAVMRPHAAEHFWDRDVEWKLHRTIYLEGIDALQLEYTQLAIYAADFRRIGTFLFEHDIYFQSVLRALRGTTSWTLRQRYLFEYLRALRFERRALRRFDSIQVCTSVNRRYLESFAWNAPPIEDGLRAGIDVSRYEFRDEGREPDTVLFVGNFRHPPNREALDWFLEGSWPLVRERRPQARLLVVGAQAPKDFAADLDGRPGVEYLGAADDIREPLGRYSVFVAPIRTGSGVRVKLLEAFAAGTPAVATRLGAEGLAEESGAILELADDPAAFADRTAALLEDAAGARQLARRARENVEQHWDMAVITRRLAERYREVVEAKRREPSG